MSLLGFGKEKSGISIIKDPFNKTSIVQVWFNYSPRLFGNGEWDCSATVRFKNGNTEAEQKFRADTFDDCVVQVKNFIDTLK